MMGRFQADPGKQDARNPVMCTDEVKHDLGAVRDRLQREARSEGRTAKVTFNDTLAYLIKADPNKVTAP